MFSETVLVLVGDELLSGRTRDVNLYRFSGILSDFGIPLVEARVVGDVSSEIKQAVEELMAEHRIVLLTGGLGPTDDDLTVQAVSDALGRPVLRSSQAEKMVLERLKHYGSDIPRSALKQADIPEGAVPVPNPLGVAPGVVFSTGERAVVCLPGVPRESHALLEPSLAVLGVGRTAVTKAPMFIRTWGLRENQLFDSLTELAEKHRVSPAFLPSPGRVDIKVSGSGAEAFCDAVIAKLGKKVYSVKRDETLEAVLGKKLVASGHTLATAESCTGGGMGKSITSVPGASHWYAGGVVTYSNRLKNTILGVKRETLANHGAVSRETALEMVRGIRELTGAECSLSVTGIAGPGGGTKEKPVGTVWTAVSCADVEHAFLWRLGGDRESVREGAIARALGTLFELLQ